MARIFISYRRRDSAYVASNLRDALQARFGMESVFFDIDNIPFGADFRQYIGNAVGKCDVLLVLIGDQWLQSADDQGRRRIDDPSDYVRIEIESAFKRKIPVVPVLVEDAKVPDPGELPESIRDLAFRNAAEIRATRDQKNQIDRLVGGLAELLGDQGAEDDKSDDSEEDTAPARKRQPVASRPKVRKSTRRKLQSSASRAPEAIPGLSQIDLDRRNAFLEQARRAFAGIPPGQVYFHGEILPGKVAAAINSYGQDVKPSSIMLLYDETALGGAKDGVILTMDAIYWHNIWAEAGSLRYSEIKSIRVSKDVLGNSKLFLNDKGIFVTKGPPGKIAHALMTLISELNPNAMMKPAPADS